MANFIKLFSESLSDNESNENLERILNMYFQNHPEQYLTYDADQNCDFILTLINNAIDQKNKTVNETELQYRAKLMNKYVIREYFHYYLKLVLKVAAHCRSKDLPINKIDAVIDILARENVITNFVRSHWFCAKVSSNDPSRIFEERCDAISKCLDFLYNMDNPHDEM